MSIRRRMTLTLVGALLILLGAAGAGLYAYVRGALIRQFDESLAARAKMLSALLHPSDGGKVEFDFSDNTMPEFGWFTSPEYFELWTESGAEVERSESLQKADLKVPSGGTASLKYWDMALPDGRAGRAVALWVSAVPDSDEEGSDNGQKAAASGPAARYLLVVARSRENLDHTLTTIGAAGIGGVGILALAFGILVPWLIVRNLRPLDTIASQANRIDATALGTRFPVETMPAELQPICGRLNDSLARLQGAFERERRFSADVAHELRTPIAELRLLSELALKFPKDGSEASRSFRDALDISRQMEAIVETLLEMMAGEAPAAADMEATDLAAVVRQSWRALEPQAAVKRASLKLSGAEQAPVSTNRPIVGRIFANLLSNAVEYSPAEAAIEWHQEAYPDRVVVTLTNPAGHLEEADLPHLAEPFWRKDAARTGSRHAGLGLALVACYAQRLNIKVRWALPRAGEFRAVLEFPR